MARDPVCGMIVDEDKGWTSLHEGQTYYFCSGFCKNLFERDPKRHLTDVPSMSLAEYLVSIEDYEQYVGPETVERIIKKAKRLRNTHVAHINATYYGGGVAELLGPLTLLMNTLGIKTGWRAIQGPPDFFSITKKIYNALQGAEINITERKLHLLQYVIAENALRNHLDHDLVVIQDPQPLLMINPTTKLAKLRAILWSDISRLVLHVICRR